MDELNRSYEFTQKAWDQMYQAVDHQYFQEMDAELIYQSLEKELKPVPFGDYLKRYIYQKAGLEGSFREIPLRDYQMIIQDSFRDHHTPASFSETTAKLSALSKNWLTQQSVKRQVVLLLGFGLGMSTEDVNTFLYKALHEQELNSLDPFEMICLYCYEHGCDYYKFEDLAGKYKTMSHRISDPEYQSQQPYPDLVRAIGDEDDLMAYLMTLNSQSGFPQMAEAVYNAFLSRYDMARELIAQSYNQESEGENDRRVLALQDQLNRNDRLYEEDKQQRIKQARSQLKIWTKDDISESDLEQILCSAIPTDRHGNLTPAKRSTLFRQFEGKRFSRKHLNEVLHRNTEADRFDLITLNFLIHAEQVDEQPNTRKRYIAFIEDTNSLLKSCFMGPLYVTNPYECFVLMCILSVSPLETYADVMEMSYDAT